MTEYWEDFMYDLRSMRSSIRGFFDSLYNFWKYRKLIWRDRFWDYLFLLWFIEAKLDDMGKNWVHNTHTAIDLETLGVIQEMQYQLKGILDDDISDDAIYRLKVRVFFAFMGEHITDIWD